VSEIKGKGLFPALRSPLSLFSNWLPEWNIVYFQQFLTLLVKLHSWILRNCMHVPICIWFEHTVLSLLPSQLKFSGCRPSRPIDVSQLLVIKRLKFFILVPLFNQSVPSLSPPRSEKLHFVAMSLYFLIPPNIKSRSLQKTKLLETENLLVYTSLHISITVVWSLVLI
jgi:hypothetical protein